MQRVFQLFDGYWNENLASGLLCMLLQSHDKIRHNLLPIIAKAAGKAGLGEDIDGLYSSDQSAPPGWHLKAQLKKELRQQVRRGAHHAGLKEMKKVATAVQDYALKFYVKVA